jgi:hypothetical protein
LASPISSYFSIPSSKTVEAKFINVGQLPSASFGTIGSQCVQVEPQEWIWLHFDSEGDDFITSVFDERMKKE